MNMPVLPGMERGRRPAARTSVPPLRPHQEEARSAITRALENPDHRAVASAALGGLRATAVMACGTGKTRVGAAAAAALASRGRVLVLVPTLDLLTQTVSSWQAAGRTGGFQVAVCSLEGDGVLAAAGVRCTTRAAQLALWASQAPAGPVTVYGTYASLRAIVKAHQGPYGMPALPAWDLVVVDEAHRTSGYIGKAWAAVHDDMAVPALRRLYLTATPRIWEPTRNTAYADATGRRDTIGAVGGLDGNAAAVAEDDVWYAEAGEQDDVDDDGFDEEELVGGGFEDDDVEPGLDEDLFAEAGPGPRLDEDGRIVRDALPENLAASMDDESVFGPVVYRLELAEAVRLGLLARPEIVVVEISDPDVHQAADAAGIPLTAGIHGRKVEDLEVYRAARLVALQSAVLRTARRRGLETVIGYHARTVEAAAFAEGLPKTAARLYAGAPRRYPRQVWSDWLYGEHEPEHRRDVLNRFQKRVTRDGEVCDTAVLANVRVLAEGIDLRADGVVFGDPKNSIVEIVQAIGRALRQDLEQGKTATIVVPVFLAPGQKPDDMLVAASHRPLVRILHALAAHDTRVVDMLAVPQTNGIPQNLAALFEHEPAEPRPADAETEEGTAGGEERPEERFLLRFMGEDRDPKAVADFLKLRVIDPERRDWRRGYLSARRWHQTHRGLDVPVTWIEYDPDTGLSYPLGSWIAEQRRAYDEGRLTARQVRLLDNLGMVWRVYEAAWAQVLAMAGAYMAVHGHLNPPKTAAINGYPIGQALAHVRKPAYGAKHPTRWAALAAIDEGWNPAQHADPERRWPLEWQRHLAQVRLHLEAGGHLDDLEPGHTVEGEDVGAWITRQARAWERLTVGQQSALTTLGIEPEVEEEAEEEAAAAAQPAVVVPTARRGGKADVWVANLAAAAAFRAREGHLTVPRKHIETVTVDGSAHEVKLGVVVANARTRQATLPEHVRDTLSSLGMRWR